MPSRFLRATTAALVLAGGTAALAHPSASAQSVTDGGVTATVDGATATLGNGAIRRSWAVTAGQVVTTSLAGPGDSDSHEWLAGAAPDFSIDVDGVPTSSTTGWALRSVTPVYPPALPGRPDSDRGAALDFRYSLVSPAIDAVGVVLERLVILHPGAGVFETRSTLVDNGPVPLRVASYALDQVQVSPGLAAEVQAYNDGSDWRDDYRHVSTPSGAFDAEGEVLRLGTDAGVFLVTERRGGSMSRVGRDATGRAWAGVDWSHDLLDEGPLQDQPPTYNRLDNPAYPAPIRARTVAPLGTVDLGTSFLGVYSGGPQEASATFTRDFVGAVQPAFDRTIGLNTFHPWSHGDGMSDQNLRTQVDAAAALGVESFMLDDQWQGGAGGESGDWRWDPARFPGAATDDKPDFVDYLQSKGLRLGLWMSPLEFNSASQTYAAHPDWACTPLGDGTAQVPDDAGLGVWDATNPQFQKYLLGVIDRLVADDGVKEFKFDFMAWVDCPPHDYADYEDAFVALVREMQAKHPDVTFELDETNDQRSWPFESAALGPSWFDNMHLHGSTQVAKLLHDVWSASPWIPPWSLGVGTFDGTLAGSYAGADGVAALMPLSLLTHVTFWSDLTQLTDDERSETKWWLSWYAAHRDDLGPEVYELTTADPIDGTSWAAWQPWHGDSGYVFAFRQGGANDTVSLPLHAVDASATYTVTDVRTGVTVGTFSGAQLAAGLPVRLPRQYSAVVLAVTPT